MDMTQHVEDKVYNNIDNGLLSLYEKWLLPNVMRLFPPLVWVEYNSELYIELGKLRAKGFKNWRTSLTIIPINLSRYKKRSSYCIAIRQLRSYSTQKIHLNDIYDHFNAKIKRILEYR